MTEVQRRSYPHAEQSPLRSSWPCEGWIYSDEWRQAARNLARPKYRQARATTNAVHTCRHVL